MLVANKNSINGFYLSLALHVAAIFSIFYFTDIKSELIAQKHPKSLSICLGSFEVPKEAVDSKLAEAEPIKQSEVKKTTEKKVERIEEEVVQKPKITEPKKIEQKIEAVEPVKVAEAKPIQDDSSQIVEKVANTAQESFEIEENFETKEEPIAKNITQSEELEQEYEKTNFHSIRDMVLANLKYPNSARRMGLQGTVELVLVIDTNGKLLDVILHKSSGHSLLDKSAIKSAGILCNKNLPSPHRISRVTLPIYFALN